MLLLPLWHLYGIFFAPSRPRKRGGWLFPGRFRQGICFVPIIILLPVVWGMNDVLYAQPIADAVTAMITVFMATRLHKELAAAEVRTPKISN